MNQCENRTIFSTLNSTILNGVTTNQLADALFPFSKISALVYPNHRKAEAPVFIIGVGRFTILGGPRFRILGGQGGPNSQRHMTS